jgi:small subunit ribosomal protein S6
VRDYELVLVISPAVGDEGFPTTVERVSNFIKDRGGQVKDVDQWGRRRLAYPITRFTEGFYAVTHFSVEPTQLRALEANLTLAEDVLRHLVVKQEEAPLSPAKQASSMGQDALVGAGDEPLSSPEDSPLSPREEAVVAAGQEESISPPGDPPVADEAAPEPEWSPASDPDLEPDAPSEEEEE